LSYNTYIGGSSLNVSTFVRNTNNAIQSIKQPYQQSDTILTTYANLGKEDAYGFSVFTGLNISNKFSLNGGSDVYYAVLKNNDPLPQYNASNEGWVYNIRMFGNYKLDKGWGLQFFGFYRGRRVQLQGYQGGFGVYSLSVRKDLLNKKGSIGIGADNFFTPAMKIHNSTTSPLVESNSTNVLHNMNFKISFSYRIGKMTFDAPRRRKNSISNDDMKEAGDNNPANAQQQQQVSPTPSFPQGAAPGQKGKARQGRPQGESKPDSLKNKVKPDSLRQDSLKGNWNKRDSLKQDSIRQDSIRQDSIKQDFIKQDSIKQDSIRQARPK
jgi:hypothetical protein